MSDQEQNKNMQELLSTILAAETVDECWSLFRVLLSNAELEKIRPRWIVMRMLVAGAKTQKEIAQTVGISPSTVSAVSTRLKMFGEGFRSVLQRASKELDPELEGGDEE